MKSDLNRLMEARALDAIIVAGGEDYSPVRDYLTNGAHVMKELILIKRGGEMLLIVGGMELDEARKSGLPIKPYAELGYMDMLKAAQGDAAAASVELWGVALKHFGVASGKIGVYGNGDINYYINFIDALREKYPEYKFVGETGLTLFDEAMTTKDTDEVARLKSVAAKTGEVLEATWNYIAGHQLSADETVVKADGSPLTIGDVKKFVIQSLMARGLEDTDMIFAQGRDGGFPHSRGESDQALKAGQAIVFDLFPREAGGGYFHDVTRTWCIGYAPPEVAQTYDTVMTAFDISVETFGVNKKAHLMQEAVMDYFEKQGHPTPRSHPGSLEGYVHGLGHGIGLNIHEAPGISHLRLSDTFRVGNCITIEPGLYYPEKGYGVRVEDSFLVTEKGELLALTTFRKDLVIPMKGA